MKRQVRNTGTNNDFITLIYCFRTNCTQIFKQKQEILKSGDAKISYFDIFTIFLKIILWIMLKYVKISDIIMLNCTKDVLLLC